MKGTGASPGVAIGKAYLYNPKRGEVTKTVISDVEYEISRFNAAKAKAIKQVEALRINASKIVGEKEAMIFDAHVSLLEDSALSKEVTKSITAQKVNADWALEEAINKFIKLLEAADNKYIAERTADLHDIKHRMLNILQDVNQDDLSSLEEAVVVAAFDLLPSDTARMDKNKVLGFVTERGTKLSHTAILARSLEIPAVVGAEGLMSQVKRNDMLALDGDTGEVSINPDKDGIKLFETKKSEFFYFKNELSLFKNLPGTTKDGHRVNVYANIGTPADVGRCIENGAEGIGLFRTEFLYMDRSSLPTEDEQFEAYKEVASGMQGKPVIIRTLDVGGDKDIPYLGLVKEENPFLGYRAIRYCLDRIDVFRTQLRAILKASTYGHIKIMFPMVTTLDELRRAKAVLDDTKAELRAEKIPFNDRIEAGIMVETPACALLADLFAKESDFFSIGTNDLIQYTMAADRGNPKVSGLYSHYNPSVLRLVKYVIECAHKNGIHAGMCGEAASDHALIPVLLGMGLDDFSVNAPYVLKTKSVINKTSTQDAVLTAEKILSLAVSNEVEQYLHHTGA